MTDINDELGLDAGDGGDETIDVEAVDTDDIVRRKRLNSLFDAKRACKEVRNEAQNATIQARNSRYEPHSYYRHAVETYVREAEALFSQSEHGRSLWTTHDFGEFELSPAVKRTASKRRSGGREKIKLVETGQTMKGTVPSETVRVQGLKSLFELSSPVTRTFEIPVESTVFGEPSTVTDHTVRQQIPFAVLDEMYAAVNGYLAEIGLDVQVEIGNATAESDYSDIV